MVAGVKQIHARHITGPRYRQNTDFSDIPLPVADQKGGVADARAPVQGPKNKKTVIFRPKYGLECVIRGLRLQKFRGEHAPGPLWTI